MPHKRTQAALGGRGWCPGIGVALQAEQRNDAAILLVSFGAVHLALGKALDTGRVDHTDDVLCIGEESSQGFPIYIGGFHTGMHTVDVLGVKPLLQLLKASGGVRKLLVTTVAALTQQGDIKRAFGEVNSENVHGVSPDKGTELVSGQPCRCVLGGTGILLGLVKQATGSREGQSL